MQRPELTAVIFCLLRDPKCSLPRVLREHFSRSAVDLRELQRLLQDLGQSQQHLLQADAQEIQADHRKCKVNLVFLMMIIAMMMMVKMMTMTMMMMIDDDNNIINNNNNDS